MHAASDLADYWDEQHRIAARELGHFVDNNPNLFGVIVATAVETAMDVGAGTVDALRFGQGMAEGGVKGFGKDALRLLRLLGPLGKIAKVAQTAANARLARLIVDPGGGICGWVSGTQALRQTGTEAFAAVEDLAKALGKNMSELGGSHLSDRVRLFEQLGAKIAGIKPVKTFEDIETMTKSDGSVTMFNVFGKRMQGGSLKNVGHAVYAFRNRLGQLKIMDRGGRAGETGQLFDSLEELAKKYRLEGEWSLREAATMENVFAKFMQSLSKAPVLAAAVRLLPGLSHKENETAAQAFEIHKAVMQGRKKMLAQSHSRYHIVAPGDWLSKIAQASYGDMHKWPVIFEANRDVIGHDPNLIKSGQKLLIPALPRISAGAS